MIDILFTMALHGDIEAFNRLDTDNKKDVIKLLELDHNELSSTYKAQLVNIVLPIEN